jgi:probable F420-dependent oxidoreductase
MRFSVGLPTDKVAAGDEFIGPGAVAEVAAAVEAAGFDACYVSDHPAPSARWLAAGGHHTVDPFVALALAAAATSRLRLQTNLLVAPYRNPFLVAKAVATLDVMSGGRVVVGVGAGYQKAEFAALGADFDDRNAIVDDTIDALRRIWTGEAVSIESDRFSAREIVSLPRPVQRPGPPVWVGGNARRAIRRAVDVADGWMPFPTPAGVEGALRTASISSVADLAERIGYLRTYADEVGRTAPLDVCFTPFGLGMHDAAGFDPARVVDEIAALAAVGVTWCTVALPGGTRRDFLEAADRFGSDVLARR